MYNPQAGIEHDGRARSGRFGPSLAVAHQLMRTECRRDELSTVSMARTFDRFSTINLVVTIGLTVN